MACVTSHEALIALNMIEHVGPVRLRRLLEQFGEPAAILSASKRALLQVHGIGEEVAETISNWEGAVDLGAELKRIEEFGCRVVTQQDAESERIGVRCVLNPPL